jgi:hypothetical protein
MWRDSGAHGRGDECERHRGAVAELHPQLVLISRHRVGAAVKVLASRHVGVAAAIGAVAEPGLGHPSVSSVGTLGDKGVQPSAVCVHPLSL